MIDFHVKSMWYVSSFLKLIKSNLGKCKKKKKINSEFKSRVKLKAQGLQVNLQTQV